jgi:hypothetical protein
MVTKREEVNKKEGIVKAFARLRNKLVRDNPKWRVSQLIKMADGRSAADWVDFVPTIMPKVEAVNLIINQRTKGGKSERRIYLIRQQQILGVLKGSIKITKSPIELIKIPELNREERKTILEMAVFAGEAG